MFQGDAVVEGGHRRLAHQQQREAVGKVHLALALLGLRGGQIMRIDGAMKGAIHRDQAAGQPQPGAQPLSHLLAQVGAVIVVAPNANGSGHRRRFGGIGDPMGVAVGAGELETAGLGQRHQASQWGQPPLGEKAALVVHDEPAAVVF